MIVRKVSERVERTKIRVFLILTFDACIQFQSKLWIHFLITCKAAIRRVVNEQSSLVFDLNLEAKVSSVFSKIWEKSETEQLSSTSLF